MTIRRNQPTKFQAFQKRCSGFAFACLILFGMLQFKSVEVAFGVMFFGVRLFIVSLGFLTFLISGTVGASMFLSNKSKFKGVVMRIVNAAFSEGDDEV